MGTTCAPPFLPSNLLNNPKHREDLINHEFLRNNPSFIFLLPWAFIFKSRSSFKSSFAEVRTLEPTYHRTGLHHQSFHILLHRQPPHSFESTLPPLPLK